MNTTDFTSLSEIFESKTSFDAIVDMISDLDLQFEGALVLA